MKVNIFAEIGKWIKGWRLDKFFLGLVNGDKEAAKQLQLTVEQSNLFVNKIREWLLSPIGDIVTYVIPGTWDNDLREQAITVLNRVTANSAALLGCMEQATVGEQLYCIYIKTIQVPDVIKIKAWWEEVATTAILVFADGKLDWSDAGLAGKLVYKLVTKPKQLAQAA